MNTDTFAIQYSKALELYTAYSERAIQELKKPKADRNNRVFEVQSDLAELMKSYATMFSIIQMQREQIKETIHLANEKIKLLTSEISNERTKKEAYQGDNMALKEKIKKLESAISAQSNGLDYSDL